MPQSQKAYGGFAFSDGKVVTAAYPMGQGGPYATPGNYYRGFLDAQLSLAAKHKYVQGWQAGGVNERIKRWMSSPDGLPKLLENIAGPPTLTTGDLSKS